MYAIAGVIGHTGRVVAETLRAKGQPIRVIVRDETNGASWKGRGAEVAVASVENEAALTRALSGVKGSYVLLPPDPAITDFFGSRAMMVDAIGRAAVKAGVRCSCPRSERRHRRAPSNCRALSCGAEFREARNRHDLRAGLVLSRELWRRDSCCEEGRRFCSMVHAAGA
jgi:hypothetical protein